MDYLDRYLGLVSLLIENRLDGKERRECGYGKASDYRVNDHGFEYRVVSSWLTTPYISAAILCLAKTIVYEFLNNSKFEWHLFTYNKSIFSSFDVKVFRNKYFPVVWKDITKMELYQNYKPYIDLIYFLVKNELTWLPKYDVKEAVSGQDCGLNIHNFNDIKTGDIIEAFKEVEVKKTL